MSNVYSQNFDRPHREYDELTPPVHPRIEVRRAKIEELSEALEITKNSIPDSIASFDQLKDVLSYNRHNIFVFCRRDKIVGVYAMLMLSSLGLERLLLGELDPSAPQPECLTLAMATPAAIYKWAVVAPGPAAEGIEHMSEFLRQPKYRHANLFAKPSTSEGRRIMERLGFRPVTSTAAKLYRYNRLANRSVPLEHAA